MSLTVQLDQQLHAETSSVIEIPDIEYWNDIQFWYVKWDTLHYALKADPDKWLELTLESETLNVPDWKRPMDVQVHELDEDGIHTGEVLAEQ